MKKFPKIFFMLMMLVTIASTSANAQNRFFLNPIDLEPGTTGTLELMLDNPDTPFYGFSVDVTLPKGLEFVMKSDGKADVTLNDDRLANSYQLVTNIKNGKLLMGTFSADPEQSIKGTSGAVAYIKVNVSPDFKESTLTLSNIKLINESDSDVPMTNQTPKIGVLPTAITFDRLGIGFEMKDGKTEEVDLTVIFTPEWTTNKTVTWESSDTNVATVDSEGKVTSVYKGTATITATTVNGKTATCYVSVGIPVTSIEMDPAEATIMDSETITIKANPLPEDADNRDFIQWYSSDETVATVDENGNVTPIKAGEVTITAQCGSASGTTELKIIPTPAESVTLNPESAEIMVGETITLTANILPETTTDKTITWSSSDPTKATVDENGTVTGVALGETTITATCGTVSGICLVTVIPTPAESVTLSAESAEMRVGESVELTASVLPDDTTDKTITWTSSDPSIATVDADGVVTGVAVGEVTVTATCGTATATCRVKVNPVLAESISLSPESVEMKVGETTTLTATILPENTTDKTIVWASEDETIATVDDEGNVTAHSLGEISISATCGSVTATSKVTVVSTPAESIELNKYTAEMEVGETLSLSATVLPETTTDKTVIWTSSDESIATVDADGIVTALSLGPVLITASCGNVSAICEVTVVPTPVTGLTLTNSELEIKVGKIAELGALIEPINATDKSVIWHTDDASIATVDENGLVTAVTPGVTIVTATSVSNPSVYAECRVTVVEDIIVVSNIMLSHYQIEMYDDETFELTATIYPENATNPTVTWRSSDPAIADVSQEGLVTAKMAGKTIVYASSSNGLTVECDVTVYARIIDPTGISLNKSELLMREGHSADLIAIVAPDNATDKTVVWTSSDAEIATVGQTGIVNAIKPGEATITATTVNGLTAECFVTVVPVVIAVEEITLNKYELTLKEGEDFNLIATISPDNATDKTITWKSSDNNVATVSDDGLVTAVRAGTASIFASSSNGLTAECTVTVIPGEIAVLSISLSQSEILMRKGFTSELIAIVRPDDATDKSVVWTSTDNSIVTVDNNGMLSAQNVGTAVIRAASGYDPTIYAECVVTVEEEAQIIAVENITLNKSELTLKEGDYFDLIAYITPDNATDKTVTWKSSDKNIATVSETGEVNAVRVGTATIYASSSNGLTAECALTVIPGEIAVESISLSNTELLMREGHTAELIAIIHPTDATDQTVTWTSDDESIVTVNNQGTVTAIKQGFAIVTATSANNLTATCAVTVVPDVIAVTGISLNKTKLTLTEEDTFTLIATITPDDATDKTVTWATSNSEVATVSDNGLVTALHAGTATIIATSSNGLRATCDVTVNPLVIDVISIMLDPTDITLLEGESATLTATIIPENATDKSVTWATNNPSVAKVEDGIVTGLTPGIATIMARSSNGKTAYCAVTVKMRPMTPRQLLRKGDGTTSTFVTMMDLSDEELTRLGYRYVVGYTDTGKNSQIIAETSLRYCHTTPQIFNNPALDFWVFSVIENEDGETVTSNLRHLDGSEEVCFDPSKYGYVKGNVISGLVNDDWVKVTPIGLLVTTEGYQAMHLSVYTISGNKVFSKFYAEEKPSTDLIDTDRFVSGTYLVVAVSGDQIKSKKIFIP